MRRFAWLFVALSLFSPIASALENKPRHLVHLLEYLARDYDSAVVNGKIVSRSEFAEQIEFSETTIKIASSIPELKKHSDIRAELWNLNHLIRTLAAADAVARVARELQIKIVRITRLETSPTKWPNLNQGKQLYANHCASCHGVSGRGDGPAGAALVPRPLDFLSENRMRVVSPFQAFNSIRIGIPGTGMEPYDKLSDSDAWDLAFYIVALRHQQKISNVSELAIATDPASLKLVASLSDDKLIKSLSGNQDIKEQTLARLRLYSPTIDDASTYLTFAKTALENARNDYREGRHESAKIKAVSAYLEGIEPVEARLRANDPLIVTELETRMSAVRSAIESGGSYPQVEAATLSAIREIEGAEALLREKKITPGVIFISAAAIILREGFEAVLVILALLGVIRSATLENGDRNTLRKASLWVHGGWIIALICGGVAWVFSGWVIQISGAHRETMEAITALFAVFVLLFLGFWLHRQAEISRWKIFINKWMDTALSGRNLIGLAIVSFIAVFREAFETVLFLRALWLEGGDSGKNALALGVFGSLSLVILTAAAVLRYSLRLPVQRIFSAASFLMILLAVILTGKGLHSLQEVGILSVTTSPFHLRSDLFGLYPTFETLVPQIIILCIIGVFWVINGRKLNSCCPPPSL